MVYIYNQFFWWYISKHWFWYQSNFASMILAERAYPAYWANIRSRGWLRSAVRKPNEASSRSSNQTHPKTVVVAEGRGGLVRPPRASSKCAWQRGQAVSWPPACRRSTHGARGVLARAWPRSCRALARRCCGLRRRRALGCRGLAGLPLPCSSAGMGVAVDLVVGCFGVFRASPKVPNFFFPILVICQLPK